ncbi:MAG TPA: cold shock domain-containing protein [Balneolaceae bacterium]|nr:cold shock domain-containing protein [Balneolaceae bacterium]
MSQQGKVKFFDTKKGFGFIAPDEGGKDIFVHRNNVAALGPNQGLEENEAVEFEVEDTPKGKSALNVKSLDYE